MFGKIEVKKALTLNQVAFWDTKDKSNTLSLEELEARKEAREEFKKWVFVEKKFWR